MHNENILLKSLQALSASGKVGGLSLTHLFTRGWNLSFRGNAGPSRADAECPGTTWVPRRWIPCGGRGAALVWFVRSPWCRWEGQRTVFGVKVSQQLREPYCDYLNKPSSRAATASIHSSCRPQTSPLAQYPGVRREM